MSDQKIKRRGRPRMSGLQDPRHPKIDRVLLGQYTTWLAKQSTAPMAVSGVGAVDKLIEHKKDKPDIRVGPARSKHDPLATPAAERPGEYEPTFHLSADQYDPRSLQVRTANPAGRPFEAPPVVEPRACDEHGQQKCRECFAPAPAPAGHQESDEEKAARMRRVADSLRRQQEILRQRTEEREKKQLEVYSVDGESAPSVQETDRVEETAERLERERLSGALKLDRLAAAINGKLSLRKLLGLTTRGVAAFLRDERFCKPLRFIEQPRPIEPKSEEPTKRKHRKKVAPPLPAMERVPVYAITDGERAFYRDYANGNTPAEEMAESHGEWPEERIVELENRIMRHAVHVGLIQLPQNKATGGSTTEDHARKGQDQELLNQLYGPKGPWVQNYD